MRVTRILPIAFLLAACSTPDDGPTVVGGAVAVAAGDQGSCAIGSSGGLACWGAVPDGTPYDTFTVGDGPDVLGAVTIETPVELISLVLQRTVDGGGNHGCVVGVNNATYCWGTLLNG